MISMLEQFLANIPLDNASTVTWIIVGALLALFVILLFVEKVRSIGAFGISLIGIDLYFYLTGGLWLWPTIKSALLGVIDGMGDVVGWIIIALIILAVLALLLFKLTAYLVGIPLGLIAIDAATIINTAVAGGEMESVVGALWYALLAFVLGFAFSIHYVMPGSDTLESTSRPFGKDFGISRVISLLVRAVLVFVLMLVVLNVGASLAFLGYILVGGLTLTTSVFFLVNFFTYADETADICYRVWISANELFTNIDIAIYTVVLHVVLFFYNIFKWIFVGIYKVFFWIFKALFWLIKNVVLILWKIIRFIVKLLWTVIKFIFKLLWKLRVVIIILLVIGAIVFALMHFGIIAF